MKQVKKIDTDLINNPNSESKLVKSDRIDLVCILKLYTFESLNKYMMIVSSLQRRPCHHVVDCFLLILLYALFYLS